MSETTLKLLELIKEGKSKEEQYRESWASNIPQEVNEEKQKKDEAKEDVTGENIEDNER
mgnify:CR=1 FL=1